MSLQAKLNAADRQEFDEMLAVAAQEGAKRALERLGLHDEFAARDLAEARSLVGAFREIKSEVWRTLARWTTYFVLGLIALAIGSKFGIGIGSIKTGQ